MSKKKITLRALAEFQQRRARLISVHRRSRGISLADWADMIGVHISTARRIEEGGALRSEVINRMIDNNVPRSILLLDGKQLHEIELSGTALQ
jgi:ribosome-binding protein aMBF1 (putative translation factor)